MNDLTRVQRPIIGPREIVLIAEHVFTSECSTNLEIAARLGVAKAVEDWRRLPHQDVTDHLTLLGIPEADAVNFLAKLSEAYRALGAVCREG